MDLKALTIHSLNSAFNVLNENSIEGIEITDKTELVLLTNFGYVTGEVVDIEKASDSSTATNDFKKFMFASTVVNRNLAIADFEEKGVSNLISDSSLVYLRNAKVTPFADPTNSFTFGDLLLFTDQVVGISGKGSQE